MPSETLLYHPLMFASRKAWRKIIDRYGPAHPSTRLTRLIIRAAMILETPARLLETRRIESWMRRENPENEPIIIVGHWRSGTTHLHNCLHSTGAFAILRHVDAIRPWAHNPLHGRFSRHLAASNRKIDRMPIHGEFPQEDEIALAAMGTLSSFHFAYFPDHTDPIFRRTVLLDGVTDEELDEWEHCLRFLFAKIRRHQVEPLPILLKNPGHTARIGVLYRRFPGSRFIHIVRHPYEVQASTRRLVKNLIQPLSLHGPSEDRFSAGINRRFREMILAHLDQRKLLPPDRYHELRYEDLTQDPETAVKGIFQHLGMDFTAHHPDRLRRYLETIRSYQTHPHPEDGALRKLVEEECGFALDLWNYR
jgi:hypothetical protein